MRPGITGYRVQSVEISRVQRHLQAVVVRPINICHLENIAQVRELRCKWSVGFLGSIQVDRAVVIERSALETKGKGATRTAVPSRSNRRLVDIANADQIPAVIADVS